MNVTILAFGKLKEDYLREAAAEYLKRLTPFAKVTVTELPPVKLPDDPSPAEIAAALEKEADAVLKKLP
ncbi:MAG: 23S rRNA (pseudouridine(1915)-N(3))-methyltransferase RlmH, partial [Clostridia bacterium]|nr:23S rRNA (pseudouridine(1915)-N(3))-methyltransferase RlmH [Clostridia bacterium]